MTYIYLWIRSHRSLQYILPILPEYLNFEQVYDICNQIIHKYSDIDEITYSEFFDICKDVISEPLSTAIFQNSIQNGVVRVRLKFIIYSMIFSGIQQTNDNIRSENRANIILSQFSTHFVYIFKLLYSISKMRRISEREMCRNIEIEQDFEFLNDILEGTVKQRHANGTSNSSVRTISQLIPLIFEESSGGVCPRTIHKICNQLISHMILDPYHIDELPFETSPILGSSRKTTLAHNSRRVVHLHNINKMELLRKDDFSDIHLRICHDKSKASFIFVPRRCETVFLDTLNMCSTIVLGAVQGVVLLRNCMFFRISVSCDLLILVNCSHLNIHCMSVKQPIIDNCENISFGPLNTTYEGHTQFLEENQHSFRMNRIQKEPIQLRQSTWKYMDPSQFVIQSTPLQTTDKDMDNLICSLPEVYRKATNRNINEGRKRMENEEKLRISDVVSNRDLLYLKSKIERKSEEDEEE